MASSTFEDQVEKLKEILEKFKKIVPSDSTLHKGEHLHYFGPINLKLEQGHVEEIVTRLKSKYERFRTISSAGTVINSVSEKNMQVKLKKPLKTCLKDVISKMRDVAKDTTLKSTIQRLEAIALEEGLRFDCEQTNNNCFISSDMFYVEIVLDSVGLAEEVKLHGHTGVPKSWKELIKILRNKDYKEFRSHMVGLKNRYLLKGDTFTKSKILTSLEAVEDDVLKIYKSDMSSNMVSDSILCGPVGYVIPRVGGKNLQMTYCVDPLQLLDMKNEGGVKVFSSDDPLPVDLGYSVTLSVRQSEQTLLPLSSLVYNENNIVAYVKQDSSNSQELPASFVLQLAQPLPTSVHIAKYLYKISTKGDTFVHSSSANLDDLILQQHINKSRLQWEEEEFTTILPDQVHYFRCVPSEDKDVVGLLLSSIPFNHPLQIPLIIKLLRCQAIYNILLCSCIRYQDTDSRDVLDRSKLVFDVTCSDWNCITVTYIHPIDETIASIDFIVSLDGIVECSLNVVPTSPVFCTNDYVKKIVNRCLSIPISMRRLFKQSESYKPHLEMSINVKTEKTLQRPMKLLMPSLQQIQNGIPLMSPSLTSSPSAFLNFSASGPGGPLFPLDKNSGPKRQSSNSDGSRTPNKLQKLPKITLKRKRDKQDIYEIDQTKSDIGEDNIEQPTSADSLSFISQFDQDVLKNSPDGLFLENDSDLAGLLGIPSGPFVHTDGFPGTSHVQAFDLDALTSGEDLNLDSTIDPSALTSAAFSSTAFDIDADGMLDIDSLMNSVP